MESLISNLVARYDRGSLSRRDLIRGLAMLAAANGTASAAPGFQSKHLEHVSITTEHPRQLADWYKDALNLHERAAQADGNIRLGLEGRDRTLIVFRNGKGTAVVDHFAIAVEPYDRAVLTADFKRRNIPTTAEGEFMITDPDGIHCQLMDDRSKR